MIFKVPSNPNRSMILTVAGRVQEKRSFILRKNSVGTFKGAQWKKGVKEVPSFQRSEGEWVISSLKTANLTIKLLQKSEYQEISWIGNYRCRQKKMYGLKELIKRKNKMSEELDITENLGLPVKNQENIFFLKWKAPSSKRNLNHLQFLYTHYSH